MIAMRLRQFFVYSVCFGSLFIFLACSSVPNENFSQGMDEIDTASPAIFTKDSPLLPLPPEEVKPVASRLVLTFGGDIMAHTPNFKMADYSMIYADIESDNSQMEFQIKELKSKGFKDKEISVILSTLWVISFEVPA